VQNCHKYPLTYNQGKVKDHLGTFTDLKTIFIDFFKMETIWLGIAKQKLSKGLSVLATSWYE